MHTVRLLLKTTEYDKYMINRRFHAISHIHNVLVKRVRLLLKKLKVNSEYQKFRTEYMNLLKKGDDISDDEKSRKRVLSKEMAVIRCSIGLTEYGLQSYIKICARQYKKLLSSQQVQKEATRVYHAVEDVLFSNGKGIHFKKFRDFHTICGKTNTNGVKFDKYSMSISWLGLNIKCKQPKSCVSEDYIVSALADDISYCEIERKMFPAGWHYYVIVYLKKNAPKKIISVGNNVSGVDIGTSSVAAVSDCMVTLKELAPENNTYNKKIIRLLRQMDISKRVSNPNKYNPDGTINKNNHDKWVFSKTYIKKRNRLKSLYRQKHAYMKQSHEEMITGLLKDSKDFIVEEMSFKGLQRRAKKTERSDQATGIKQKDGTIKPVKKYKRKKRFGRSLNNRAPAMFITILKCKAELYGGTLTKVKTKEFRASQYNHYTDDYEKHDLKDRCKYINGKYVQRDLYSAYLLKNSNKQLNKPDREKCICGFKNFLELQDNLISQMKQNNISMKQCFGF